MAAIFQARLLFFLLALSFAMFAVNTEAMAVETVELGNVTVQVDQPQTVLTTQDMNDFGVMFPDEPIGFVATPVPNQFMAFGAGGSFSGISGKAPDGTYRFGGPPWKLAPMDVGPSGPLYALTSGSVQPSPDGSNFDRDYGGGGPTYWVQLQNLPSSIATSAPQTGLPAPVLLQIYHGEYHYSEEEIKNSQCGAAANSSYHPAYGGSGLALSVDNGHSFVKLGQILYPYVTRTQYINRCPTPPRGGLWSDASMIRANNHGEYIGDHFLSTLDSFCQDEKRAIYDYVVFTDQSSATGPNYIGLARARECDVRNAVESGKAPIFYKYYNPSGGLVFEDQYFTQPGVTINSSIPVGGQSTPIAAAPSGLTLNSPMIVWDRSTKQYILSYQVMQQYIALRVSTDLMHWSPEAVVVDLRDEPNQRLFDPSILGKYWSYDTPNDNFFIYYLQREYQLGSNGAAILNNPTLRRVMLKILPQSQP